MFFFSSRSLITDVLMKTKPEQLCIHEQEAEGFAWKSEG